MPSVAMNHFRGSRYHYKALYEMALAKLGVLYRAFLCTPRYIISETVDHGVVTLGFASGSGEILLAYRHEQRIKREWMVSDNG